MENLVERENREMKLLSGDCAKLKKELSETRSQYGREYQTRVQVEGLVERLRRDTGKLELDKDPGMFTLIKSIKLD
jgi:hypothetical protein